MGTQFSLIFKPWQVFLDTVWVEILKAVIYDLQD